MGILNAVLGTYGLFSMYNSLLMSTYKIEGDVKSEAGLAESENGTWADEINNQLTSRKSYVNSFCANVFGMCCCTCCSKRWECSR